VKEYHSHKTKYIHIFFSFYFLCTVVSLSSCWFVFFNVSLHQQLKKSTYKFIYIYMRLCKGFFCLFFFLSLSLFSFSCFELLLYFYSLFSLSISPFMCFVDCTDTEKKKNLVLLFFNSSDKERNEREEKKRRTMLFTCWRKPSILTHISMLLCCSSCANT